jgi:hypothetical protein
MDQAREEMARRWQRLDAILTIGGSKNKRPVKGRSGRLYKLAQHRWRTVPGGVVRFHGFIQYTCWLASDTDGNELLHCA